VPLIIRVGMQGELNAPRSNRESCRFGEFVQEGVARQFQKMIQIVR
jgi:hypothetical protein